MPLIWKELVYTGNLFTIKDQSMAIHPLKSRAETIQKIPPAKAIMECKSFCGVVNYLNLFCLSLQKLLRHIYDLTHMNLLSELNIIKSILMSLRPDSFNLLPYISLLLKVSIFYIVIPATAM